MSPKKSPPVDQATQIEKMLDRRNLVWGFFSGKNLKLVESAELVWRSLEAGVNEL